MPIPTGYSKDYVVVEAQDLSPSDEEYITQELSRANSKKRRHQASRPSNLREDCTFEFIDLSSPSRSPPKPEVHPSVQQSRPKPVSLHPSRQGSRQSPGRRISDPAELASAYKANLQLLQAIHNRLDIMSESVDIRLDRLERKVSQSKGRSRDQSHASSVAAKPASSRTSPMKSRSRKPSPTKPKTEAMGSSPPRKPAPLAYDKGPYFSTTVKEAVADCSYPSDEEEYVTSYSTNLSNMDPSYQEDPRFQACAPQEWNEREEKLEELADMLHTCIKMGSSRRCGHKNLPKKGMPTAMRERGFREQEPESLEDSDVDDIVDWIRSKPRKLKASLR